MNKQSQAVGALGSYWNILNFGQKAFNVERARAT